MDSDTQASLTAVLKKSNSFLRIKLQYIYIYIYVYIYRGIRANLPNQYFGDLQCRVCLKEQENQPHIHQCTGLRKSINVNSEVSYEHNHGTLEEQIPVTILIFSLLEERDMLLEGELAHSYPNCYLVVWWRGSS